MEITLFIIALLAALALVIFGLYLVFRLVRFGLRLITVWEQKHGFD